MRVARLQEFLPYCFRRKILIALNDLAPVAFSDNLPIPDGFRQITSRID